MFYSLIKSYDTLNNTTIPSRKQCIDDMKGEMMPLDEYDHMVKLWKTFDIKTKHGESTTNCTMYSM